MKFLHLVKVVHDNFEDKYQIWSQLNDANLLFLSILNVYTTYMIPLRPGNMKVTKIRRQKGRYLTQSDDKNPYTHRKIQTAKWQNATNNFDYITIAYRLRAVNRNNNHPTGVVKPVNGYPTFPCYHNSRAIKMTHIQKCVHNPHVKMF